jgi:hypothetical protein
MKTRFVRVALTLLLVGSALPMAFTSAQTFENHLFHRTWARTDLPVAQGHIDRTWMWGPAPFTEAFEEPYGDAPGGMRLVQYTDKSRMEDNSFRAEQPWDVTNGRLAYELITGQMQISDADYEERQPANVHVAGDPHHETPTYATFQSVLDHDPLPDGTTIAQTIDQHGNVGNDESLAQYGVTAEYYVPDTGHTVASVFWAFMNASGPVFENGQTHQAPLFENPFFAVGFPITEAYWVHVPVAGEWQHVLAQCFERRCLTFTPGNNPGWQVEAGNIGQHYYEWRYNGEQHDPPADPGEPSDPSDDSPDPQFPDDAVNDYLQAIDPILLSTVESFEVYFDLVENPTLTAEWWSQFNAVMNDWKSFRPNLVQIEPPPGVADAHAELLDAYQSLGTAADLLIDAFQNDNQVSYESALEHIDDYFGSLNRAFQLLPYQ